MDKKKRKKVVLAMSGGVDSSVSAAILKKQGYEIMGVFMRFWKEPLAEKKDRSIEDVKNIAKKIGIRLKIIDARKKFKKEVAGYFLKEYAFGRTPNPCIFCNENIKFKILFQEMEKMKADYIATGHYARIMKHETWNMEQKKYKLLEAKDKNKDQSYFLYRLKQKQLARTIFPLGEYKKEEVRALAKKFNLTVFDKAESQDICFLANISVEEFLKKNIKLKKGKIINMEGKIIGEHSGLPLYTLGQRKGINIGGTGPYYVAKKDIKKNQLSATNKKEDLFLFSKFANLKEVNWIFSAPKTPAKVLARIRYQSLLILAVIKKEKNGWKIVFEKPQRAVTPGQSAVFYSKKGEVLGGGIIK